MIHIIHSIVLFHASVIRSKWATSMIFSDSFSSVTKIKDKKSVKCTECLWWNQQNLNRYCEWFLLVLTGHFVNSSQTSLLLLVWKFFNTFLSKFVFIYSMYFSIKLHEPIFNFIIQFLTSLAYFNFSKILAVFKLLFSFFTSLAHSKIVLILVLLVVEFH